MMSLISGPYCDLDIEPDQIFYGKVVFTLPGVQWFLHAGR